MDCSPRKTLPWERFQATNYFPALDGLRAVSILMVLAHHVSRFPAQHWLHTLQENGRYGVSFFFVISGFLITTLFLREEETTGRINLWKFYGRRALRLLPLYYAVLALQAVFVFAFHQYSLENQRLFSQKLASYLFYYSNWLPTATQGPFFQAWSLAVEEQFYLGFGLLLFFTNRRWVVGAAVAALLVKAAAFAAFGAVDARSTFWRIAFSYQEPILLGVLAAFALNRRLYYEFFARWLCRAGLPACFGAATAGWIALHPMRLQSSWDAQLLYLLMTLSLGCLVVRPATPVLGSRFMVHLGKVSYGIYLLHMFVISAVKKLPGGTSPAICFLLSTAAIIPMASVVYRFFEQPIIAFYKSRLSPLRSDVPAPQLAARIKLPELSTTARPAAPGALLQ